MRTDFINIGILAALFLLLFAVSELLYHFLKVKAEITRKLTHFGTGLLTLLFPVMLTSHWSVLILCLSFALLLFASLRFGFLKSINAIGRESAGSICYPVSVFICYLAFEHFGEQYIYFYLPILILAISDPIAALSGKKWPYGRYRVGKEHKSLTGSSFFFLSAFAIYLALAMKLNHQIISLQMLLSAVLIAALTTTAEAFSRKGYDNISIPIAGLMGLYLLLYL